jgi:lysophospholipase L1-like esterase
MPNHSSRRRTLVLALSVSMSLLVTSFVRGEDKPADSTGTQPASVTPMTKSSPKDPKVERGFLKRHEGFLKDKEEAMKKGNVDLLFVGDSITDGWRRGEQFKLMQERWGKYNFLNLGIGGDRTEHVLWRLDNGEVDGLKPKAVMLMIGTNNLGTKQSPEDTILGVKAVVAKLREKLPDSKILLLAIFPRGNKADDPFRAQIKQVNEAIAKLDDGQHVKYLDIGDKFLTPDGELTKEIMPDFLHPNAKGYQIWADAVEPSLDEMLK